MPFVTAAQYARPGLIPYIAPLACYLALAAGVIAHNHNHCPTFKSRRSNQVFSTILSFFYGYPTFAWVPTHNMNHHKLVNRAGDATITWRFTNKHNWFVAATYFFVSSYYQSDPIKAYIGKARLSNRPLYRQILQQYVMWGGMAFLLLGIAVGLHGWRLGLRVWLLATVAPALFALWTIMLFNYIQHVHTDPWSEHDHSRSFVSPLLNFLLFNNGFHGAHHENPGMHWSALPVAHAAISAQMSPALQQKSMWWFFFKQYVLALFFPSLGTRQIGRAPFAPPDGGAVNLAAADVALVELGTNTAKV